MWEAQKPSHFNLIPGVEASNIPYISSVDLGDIIMPKEKAAILADEARKAGAFEKADQLD